MRKIVVGAQVSMDGIMQAPGGPWEDLTKGFAFGGWVMPYFDAVFGEEIDRVFKEKFDLLPERKTYEIFAAYWPYYGETAPPRPHRARCSRTSRSTSCPVRATSIRTGRARCCCVTSPT
jgi:hypothetical protein